MNSIDGGDCTRPEAYIVLFVGSAGNEVQWRPKRNERFALQAVVIVRKYLSNMHADPGVQIGIADRLTFLWVCV